MEIVSTAVDDINYTLELGEAGSSTDQSGLRPGVYASRHRSTGSIEPNIRQVNDAIKCIRQKDYSELSVDALRALCSWFKNGGGKCFVYQRPNGTRFGRFDGAYFNESSRAKANVIYDLNIVPHIVAHMDRYAGKRSSTRCDAVTNALGLFTELAGQDPLALREQLEESGCEAIRLLEVMGPKSIEGKARKLGKMLKLPRKSTAHSVASAPAHTLLPMNLVSGGMLSLTHVDTQADSMDTTLNNPPRS
ncbi:hypothetical protein GQ42DRAFT_162135 [Ramicandelaber brevisporus]|nr:hypothetical protein GQ42DRAFT_162135 [Ramicandelaber brevisporus]